MFHVSETLLLDSCIVHLGCVVHLLISLFVSRHVSPTEPINACGCRCYAFDEQDITKEVRTQQRAVWSPALLDNTRLAMVGFTEAYLVPSSQNKCRPEWLRIRRYRFFELKARSHHIGVASIGCGYTSGGMGLVTAKPGEQRRWENYALIL